MRPEKPITDFGASLRDARERRGLSLRVIADTTKISVRALEALERNDISRLPGGIFSRSFVRAYAVQVGLDPEHTITEFLTRFPVETVTQGHPRTRILVDELEREAHRGRWPGIVKVSVVAVPVVLLAAYVGLADRRAPRLPAERVAVSEQQSETAPMPRGITPTPARATPTAAEAAATMTSGRGVSITIHATRSTTFSVLSDGAGAIDVSLQAGAARTFTASRDIVVMPSDPSAIEWSTAGSPARRITGPVTFTPETVQGGLAGRE